MPQMMLLLHCLHVWSGMCTYSFGSPLLINVCPEVCHVAQPGTEDKLHQYSPDLTASSSWPDSSHPRVRLSWDSSHVVPLFVDVNTGHQDAVVRRCDGSNAKTLGARCNQAYHPPTAPCHELYKHAAIRDGPDASSMSRAFSCLRLHCLVA